MQQGHVVHLLGIAQEVRRQGRLGGAHAPNMNVMHRRHPWQLGQGAFHGISIDAWRDPVEAHQHRLTQQGPAGPGHGQAHANTGEGIKPVDAGELNQQGADQHRSTHRRIGEQVHHRSSAVEIVAVVVAKQTGRAQVHRNAQQGRHRHRARG